MASGASGHSMCRRSQAAAAKEKKHPEVANTLEVRVKLDGSEFTFPREQRCTVLDAIAASGHSANKLVLQREKIFIQGSAGDQDFTVPTHCPCPCLSGGVTLTVSVAPREVEVAPGGHLRVGPRSEYSVFFIGTRGGKYAKSKMLVRNKVVTKVQDLLVYAEKGVTVEEALKRDGRFVDDLSAFFLCDHNDPDRITKRTAPVDALDGKRFRICYQRAGTGKRQKNPDGSVSDLVARMGSGNVRKIFTEMCRDYPGLSKWLNPESGQERVQSPKEDFGKDASERRLVDHDRKLLAMGDSICKVGVQNVDRVSLGTGFVLVGNLVLTNAHVLGGCVAGGETLRLGVSVTVCFNYEVPDKPERYATFPIKERLVCFEEDELDFAVLEIDTEDRTRIPPGLLGKFSDLPVTGQACIMSHPGGTVKVTELIRIIDKGKREEAVALNVPEQYRDYIFTICAINECIRRDKLADTYVTYDTSMFQGASGSPVFSRDGNSVFGLHSGGYFYEFLQSDRSVMEYGQPLLLVFAMFVSKLREEVLRGEVLREEVLREVQREAQGNVYLEAILEAVVGPRVEE